MRLVPLKIEIYYGENNGRMNFRENNGRKDKEMEYGMKEIINR